MGYGRVVRDWIPRPTSAKGRLALVALDAFGRQGFAAVNVVELAQEAGVTTGALYHHFGSKQGLYEVVREEAQRRVLDRMEGAVAARPDDSPADAAQVALLVAFDYCVAEGLAGLLAEAEPGRHKDPIEAFLAGLTDHDGVPVACLLAAAWRAALHAAATDLRIDRIRRALSTLTIHPA